MAALERSPSNALQRRCPASSVPRRVATSAGMVGSFAGGGRADRFMGTSLAARSHVDCSERNSAGRPGAAHCIVPKSRRIAAVPDVAAEHRAMLTARRRELAADIAGRIQRGRGGPGHEIRDAMEQTDADTQNDLSMALLQSKAAMLARVDQALMRLDAGTYGVCASCADPIATARLSALPFAIRCQACESARERDQRPRRQHELLEIGKWKLTT